MNGKPTHCMRFQRIGKAAQKKITFFSEYFSYKLIILKNVLFCPVRYKFLTVLIETWIKFYDCYEDC